MRIKGPNPKITPNTDGSDAVSITKADGTTTVLSANTSTGAVSILGAVDAPTITASTAIADNTSTTQVATTAFVNSAVASKAKQSQAVNLTAAASGSNGIQVADNDNIDPGTGNFAITFRGSLPDWTVASILVQKLTASVGYQLEIVATTGYIKLTLNTTAYTSSVAPSFVAGTKHEITAVVTVGTVNTTVDFYADGVALGVQQTAANPGTVSSTAVLYTLGTSAVRTVGTCEFATVYNRALTAAQVLDLYRNGIAFADKWGSQTNIITGNDSTFAGASNWVNVNLGTYDETTDGVLTIAGTTGQYCYLPAVNAPFTPGKNYRLTFTVGAAPVGSMYISDSATGALIVASTFTLAAGTKTIEFTVTNAAATGGIQLYSGSADMACTIDNVSLVEIGATLALEPEGIQPSPGQWLDSSTNKLHAIQPAVGSSITRLKKDFEIRWTNTWAATHEAQYIGGVNQAVLPVGCYITNIIGTVTGGTIEDIIIGDGSDDNRFVVLTDALATGVTNFAIAAATSDGTNYKLVVDPDANFTGSIEWLIRGVII
jgi:hypothetical protein